MTFSVAKFSIIELIVTLSTSIKYYYSECCYAECHVLNIVILNVIILSVVMMSVAAIT
jgi:hypothetical protein